MQDILKEQGFQQSGCVSDACIVEVGQLLGVRYMVAGSIGKLGRTYTMSIRLIDVQTGEIFLTADTDCRCSIEEVLSNSTVDIAQRLCRGVGGGSKTLVYPQNSAEAVESCEVSIYTEPPGVRLSIDGFAEGVTPYRGVFSPGQHKLRLTKSTYSDLTKTLVLPRGGRFRKTFKLEHTTQYLDSIRGLTNAKQGTRESLRTRKTGRVLLRVALGVAGAGAIAGGVMLDQMGAERVAAATQIAANYRESKSNSSYEELAAEYRSTIDEAEELVLGRNVCYGVAGLSVGALGVTMIFRFSI